MIGQTFQWLFDPASWSGQGGILAQSLAHLRYSFIALLVASAIAVPIGLWVGHTGRGQPVIFAPKGCVAGP